MLASLADAVAGRDVDVVAAFCVSPLLGELFAVPPLGADRWKRDGVAAFEQRRCAPLRNADVAFRTRAARRKRRPIAPPMTPTRVPTGDSAVEGR